MNRRTMCKGSHPIPRAIALAAALVAMAPTVFAAEEAEGITGSDMKVTWSNTFKYGGALRLQGQDSTLLGNPNADDGDRNFGRGPISNRIELLSELDVLSRNGFGGRVSAVGWYDTVYNRSNDNLGFAGGAFPNQTSVGSNQFTSATKNAEGRKVELRDAFLFGKADIGELNHAMAFDVDFAVRVGENV